MKKIPVIFISFLLGVSALWGQQVKLFVKVDRAVVYAEPSENSYKIDIVRRGTELTLFEKGIETSDWWYVAFRSKRWKGEVTGFIKRDLVFTEEEWLREDQRRMEEEEAAEAARQKTEEKTETEMKAEAEEKPEPKDELPDLRAAFAKKKTEPVPVEVKPEEQEAIKEQEPVAEEKGEEKEPEPVPEKEVETKKPEPVAVKPETKPAVKEKEPVQVEQKQEVKIPELVPEEVKPEEEEAVKESEPLPEKEVEAKPEPVEVKPEKKEILEETPQSKEISAPETREVEAEEFKKPEPPPPVVTITDGITDSPRGRTFALYHTGVMAEEKPYAIIMREFKPPPVLLKAEEKVADEAPAELQADVMPVKEEEPPPEEEEKAILEETPQAKEIAAPEEGIAEETEFKKPEPPPPIVTVFDSVTDSPQSRSLSLSVRPEFLEMMVYKFVVIEPPKPEIPEVREVKAEETTKPVKEEATPPPTETEEKEEATVEPQVDKPTEQEIKPPTQVVKPPEQEIKSPEQVVPPTEMPPIKPPGKVGLLSFAVGYGPSWGGFGGAVQLNVSENISIHVGGGMYPTKNYYSDFDWVTNEWLYSIGIKYYLPFFGRAFRPYVDVMYGGIAVEAVQLVKEIWYYEYTYENIQKVLYGPSAVAGADLKLGFIGLTGYLGLSYNTTAWDYWDRDYFLNGGLGISLYF